jgi:hypothetical protein
MALELAEQEIAFVMLADTGLPCEFGDYPHPIVHDLQSLITPAGPTPVLFGHAGPLIAYADRLQVQNGRLLAWGTMKSSPVDYALGRNIANAARAGTLWEVSAGTHTNILEYIECGDAVVVNGRKLKGPVFVARRARLAHLAVVPERGAADTSYVLFDGTVEHLDFAYKPSLPPRATIIKSKIAYLKAEAEADRILAEGKALAWRSPLAREAERQARAWQAARDEDRRHQRECIQAYRDQCEAERRKPRPESLIEQLERQGREREAERQRNVLAGSR